MTKLKLGCNGGLNIPPSWLKLLKNLTHLDLNGNYLSVLPSELSSCTALKVLDISANSFQTLPATMRCLTNLTELFYRDNGLTKTPPELDSFVSLKTLNLSANPLTTLSPAICAHSALTELNLKENPIRALPSEIRHRTSCHIQLENHELSESVSKYIQQQSLIGSSFPQIHGYKPLFKFDREHSVGGFVQKLESIAKFTRQIDPDQLCKGDSEFKIRLHSWIFRLFEYADFKRDLKEKAKLAQRMCNLLKLASEDPQFRAVFRSVVIASAQTKDTRVALSLLDVEVQYQLALCDKSDLPSLSRLLSRGSVCSRDLKRDYPGKAGAILVCR